METRPYRLKVLYIRSHSHANYCDTCPYRQYIHHSLCDYCQVLTSYLRCTDSLESLDGLPFEQLDHLYSIGISTTWPDEDIVMEHSLTARKCTAVQPNLRSVEFPYHSPFDVPLNRLPSLAHLGLVVMRSLEGLDTVLRQVPQLRSLSVFSPSLQENAMFEALSSLKPHLPCLESLALQCYDGSTLPLHHAGMLGDFLRDRRAMRRLYCNFEVPPESMPAYMSSVGTLKNLQIFDLRMTQQAFTHEFVSDMLSSLPRGLAAMKLTSKGGLGDASVFARFVGHTSYANFRADSPRLCAVDSFYRLPVPVRPYVGANRRDGRGNHRRIENAPTYRL